MIKLVKLNESYDMVDRLKQFVKTIHTYYAYDESAATHCCELTPSFELHPVACEATPYDSVGFNEDGDISEKLGDIEQGWLSECDIVYQHCRSLSNCHPQDTPFEDIEEAVEYYRSNPPCF